MFSIGPFPCSSPRLYLPVSGEMQIRAGGESGGARAGAVGHRACYSLTTHQYRIPTPACQSLWLTLVVGRLADRISAEHSLLTVFVRAILVEVDLPKKF